MMKVALISNDNASAGGNITLINELMKCENDFCTFIPFIRNYSKFEKNVEKKNDVRYFDTYEELLELTKTFHYVMFISLLPLWNDKIYFDYKMFMEKSQSKLIYANINRTVKSVNNHFEDIDDLKDFDCILTLVDETTKTYKMLSEAGIPVQTIDMNLFDFDFVNVDVNEKRDVISYVGRFVGCKGIGSIFKEHEKLVKTKYIITVDGGNYSIRDSKITAPISVLAYLVDDIKIKQPKPQNQIHSNYSSYDNLVKHKLNVFPIYDKEDEMMRVFENKFVLFPALYKTKRYDGLFTNGIEFVWLECISVGTPPIITKNFAGQFKIAGKTLLDFENECGVIMINDFSEIEEKCAKYEEKYNENVFKMQCWWENNYNKSDKLKMLIKILKAV